MKVNKYTAVLVRDRSVNYDEAADRPDAIVEMLRRAFKADVLPNEHIWEICLNSRLNVVGLFEVGIGATSYCVTDIAGVARNALLTGAAGVVLVHNHPSGNLEASNDDVAMTKRVRDGLELLGIQLQDHLIVSNKGYVSMREDGLI